MKYVVRTTAEVTLTHIVEATDRAGAVMLAQDAIRHHRDLGKIFVKKLHSSHPEICTGIEAEIGRPQSDNHS